MAPDNTIRNTHATVVVTANQRKLTKLVRSHGSRKSLGSAMASLVHNLWPPEPTLSADGHTSLRLEYTEA